MKTLATEPKASILEIARTLPQEDGRGTGGRPAELVGKNGYHAWSYAGRLVQTILAAGRNFHLRPVATAQNSKPNAPVYNRKLSSYGLD